MRLSTQQLENWSYIATIIAASVAAFALIVGGCQFSITQKMQQEALELERETQIISLNNEYQKLQQESNDDSFDWKSHISVSIAESIYNLDKNGDWESTVGTMIADHQAFIMEEKLECDTYTEGFQEITAKVLNTEQSSFCKNVYDYAND